MKGIEHTVEVTTDTLYEVVAHGLRAFRDVDWAAEIGWGNTTITIVVKQSEVEHRVRVRDFETWLESAGHTPVEMSLKNRLRKLLGKRA